MFNGNCFQIHNDFDDLNRQLQNRRGNVGNSAQAVKMTSEAFRQFQMTIQVNEVKDEERLFIYMAHKIYKKTIQLCCDTSNTTVER